MHEGQVPTSVELVHELLQEQFPQWADRTITAVLSAGTDHDLYRLGDDLAVRLPRIGWAASQPAMDYTWMPRLAKHLPLRIPRPTALGRPTADYPFEWLVCEWLPGADASNAALDLDPAASDLAAFVRALRGIDTDGAHAREPGTRGGPLVERDQAVREALEDLGDRIDGAAALRSWDESLEAPSWDGDEVWIHGDLMPGNLLVVDGRLSAVIDFGGLNVGDPACDLQPAWHLFSDRSRTRFRTDLDVDDASWLRGRGWVLSQAVIAMPYYWDSNPGMVRVATHSLAQVLADSDQG